jgi:hypothetical protein
MRYAHRLAHAESLEEQNSAERTFNKLARTFAALVEARQRNRAASDAKNFGQNVQIDSEGVRAIGRPAHDAGLKTRERAVRASENTRRLSARRKTGRSPAA